MKITCIDKNVGDILLSSYYKIPRFQRPYSWDRSNVDDLWRDLIENDPGYFIGSMVMFKDSAGYGLVDGQQRLTTVTMLLAALRNELYTRGAENEARGLQGLIERRDIDNRLQFVLQTETSYPYLQSEIQEYPGDRKASPVVSREEQALAASFYYLRDLVGETVGALIHDPSIAEEKRNDAVVQRLVELRERVMKLALVLVEVDDEDEATIIFQTLNSRGKDLEVSDLVKSHLLSHLRRSNKNYDPARDRWNAILESFSESQVDLSMNRFLLHSWLSRYDYTSEKKLFKAIKSQVRRDDAEEFLERLTNEAEIYRQIQEPSYRSWSKQERPIRDSLNAFILFRLQQPVPFILSLLREYEAKTLKLKVVVTGLRLIENYHFIATAVTNQPSSGGVSAMYAASARALLGAQTPQTKLNVITELSTKLRNRLPSRAEFLASWAELRSSKQYTQQARLVRYALEKLASSAAPDGNPIDYDQMSIEHLAPQGTRAGLPLADVAQIGNLLLIPRELNESLGDRPFKDKIAILSEKGFLTGEPELQNSVRWAQSQIESRTQRLGLRAFNYTWKI